ncbi:MAG: hypothetical protein ISP91_07285 [Pseudomonadales bacterium]|jgi:hypothetical protein|nr:hypothetical protein [Pseudomonadales bacterium]
MSDQAGESATQSGPDELRASRIKLLTLIAIAFVPIFIAYIAYFQFPAIAPSGTTNQGQLVWPVVDGNGIDPMLAELENWALIQPLADDCAEDCRQMMYLSRQVVTGLGKNTDRVQRVLLSESSLPEELASHVSVEHKDALVIEADTSLFQNITRLEPVLFLMDPNGNIMMYYSLDKAGKPMLKDLKHLLKISNIG